MVTQAGEITKLGKCLLCKHEDLGSKHGTTKLQLIRKQRAIPQKSLLQPALNRKDMSSDRQTIGLGRWSGHLHEVLTHADREHQVLTEILGKSRIGVGTMFKGHTGSPIPDDKCWGDGCVVI